MPPHRAFAVVVAFGVAVTLACGSSDSTSPNLGSGCKLNSDCSGGLVCALGACTACGADEDCAVGSRCLRTAIGASCVTPASGSCVSARCQAGAVCASEGECRTDCTTGGVTACAAGQNCLSEGGLHVCVGSSPDHDTGGGAGGSAGFGGTGGHSGKTGSGGSSGSSGASAGGSGNGGVAGTASAGASGANQAGGGHADAGHGGGAGAAGATAGGPGAGGAVASGGGGAGGEGGTGPAGGQAGAGGSTSGGAGPGAGGAAGGEQAGGAAQGGAGGAGQSGGGAGGASGGNAGAGGGCVVTCDPLANTGCPAGDVCSGSIVVSTTTIQCNTPLSPNDVAKDQPCTRTVLGVDNCQPKLVCTREGAVDPANAADLACRKFCLTDVDCTTAGERCVAFSADPQQCTAYGVCLAGCQPFGNPCAAGAACTAFDRANLQAAAQPAESFPPSVSRCLKIGAAFEGEPCKAGGADCAAALTCIPDPLDGTNTMGTCRPLCTFDGVHGCPSADVCGTPLSPPVLACHPKGAVSLDGPCATDDSCAGAFTFCRTTGKGATKCAALCSSTTPCTGGHSCAYCGVDQNDAVIPCTPSPGAVGYCVPD